MSKDQVLKDVEAVIKAAKIDIKKNGCTSDKIRQLASLVNAFTRLLTRSEILDGTDDGNGDPNYYERLVAKVDNGSDVLPN